jgi:ribosome-associated protein
VRRATKEDIVLTGPQQAVAPRPPWRRPRRGSTPSPAIELLTRVIASLEDDKAEDIVQIDLRGKSAIADWMVVASGRSSRQVASISEKLVERLKQEHGVPCKIEGKDAGDWVLIDAGDVIVHVFRPEVRDFYQLEKMWLPAGGRHGAPPNRATRVRVHVLAVGRLRTGPERDWWTTTFRDSRRPGAAWA